MADLERVKNSLCDALREKTPQYWELMKSWYKQKIPKDEFDRKAKVLLGEAGVQLHNDFLFSILVKCQTVSQSDVHVPSSLNQSITSSVGSERGVKRPKLDHVPAKNVTPFGVFNETRYAQPLPAMLCGKDLDRILMCSHELMLPDLPTLHTRILLIAWESGLDGADEDTAHYMIKAIEIFLKSVLTACVTSRSSWRLRSNRFQHGFGKGYTPTLSSQSKDALLTNKNRSLAFEAMEAERHAKTPSQAFPEPISCFDLRDALRTYGTTCIPSHYVRTVIMERILGSMWHPSTNDLSNTETLRKWKQCLMK